MVLTVEEIEDVLKKNLKDVSAADIRRASQAIVQASGKWREVDLTDSLGALLSVQCKDICTLGEAFSKGCHIRAFITQKN